MSAAKILRDAGVEVPISVDYLNGRFHAGTPVPYADIRRAIEDLAREVVKWEAVSRVNADECRKARAESEKWKQRADALESQLERGTVFNEATMATLREREQEAKS